jgi:CubicO group peptidase (beta-lactamase class C family)
MTLPLDREVRHLAPRFSGADFTVRDLVEHTSGLPRLPVGMGLIPLRDPYLPTVGAPLDPGKVVRIGDRGKFVYSNLGYALLGALLDDVDGDWFLTVRKHILEPAGIATATTAPPGDARVVPRRGGRPIQPWTMTGSPYAAAGGIWSTFEDLCRYADWALGNPGDLARTVAWQRREATTWINGQVRAAGAVIVSAGGITAVVHALAQRLFTPDRIASRIIERTLELRRA